MPAGNRLSEQMRELLVVSARPLGFANTMAPFSMCYGLPPRVTCRSRASRAVRQLRLSRTDAATCSATSTSPQPAGHVDMPACYRTSPFSGVSNAAALCLHRVGSVMRLANDRLVELDERRGSLNSASVMANPPPAATTF